MAKEIDWNGIYDEFKIANGDTIVENAINEKLCKTINYLKRQEDLKNSVLDLIYRNEVYTVKTKLLDWKLCNIMRTMLLLVLRKIAEMEE